MFSIFTRRFLHYGDFKAWFAAVHAASARVSAMAQLVTMFDPHLLHHWDIKARIAAFFAPSVVSSRDLIQPRADVVPGFFVANHTKIKIWLREILCQISRPSWYPPIPPLAQIFRLPQKSHIGLLNYLDDRVVPHPGVVAERMVSVTRDVWYSTWKHLAILLGGYEQLEIVVRTDNHPKQVINPGKGKRTIVFGSGCECVGRNKEYVSIPDDELFQEHLVIGYSRLHGWQIKKMEGEFGCGFQYSTDSINAAIPLSTDCAIMRIGHTSILINVVGSIHNGTMGKNPRKSVH